jgi:PDDEXK-like domain of unknown function (DUF3799)
MIDYNMSMEDYLSHPALNSSKLKLMLKTSLDFKEGLEEENNETKSTLLGTAVHTLLLEPQTFEARYALQTEEFGDKRSGETKKRWDAFKNENKGKTILDQKESLFLVRLKEKVRKNTHLRLLIAGGQSEIVGISEAQGLALKARADLLTKDTIWDVKTTIDGVDDANLYRTIKKYRYDFQAAHYFRIFNELMGNKFKNFGWIFVDTSSPAQHIRLIKAPEIMIRRACMTHAEVILSVLTCMENNTWPGWPTNPTELEMPHWAEELK